jgi:2,3-bisphosphoglycerate-independent phosphoglycerate mutase
MSQAGRKFAIIILDGASDQPQEQLERRTPLQAARKPALDRLAREGICGLARMVPESAPTPGSVVAVLSILGYDPSKYDTGRAPLEAAAMGLPMDPEDVAFRCNLVTTDGERLLDYSGGEVTTEEARDLIGALNQKLADRRLRFFPGISYRHLMVWRQGPVEVKLTPPHDIQGEPFEPHLPAGDGEDRLRSLIWNSLELLDGHEVNRRRRDEGKLPANMVWFWDQGRAVSLPSFSLRWGVTGAVIAAVDLVRGLGKCAGLKVLSVPGATGNLKTDFAAKGRAAVEALDHYDLVVVHIEAPDEASHQGDLEGKIWAIEQIDHQIAAPLARRLAAAPSSRMLALADHETRLSLRTHTREPVPFAMSWPRPDVAEGFDEVSAAATGRQVEEGHRLIEVFFEE